MGTFTLQNISTQPVLVSNGQIYVQITTPPASNAWTTTTLLFSQFNTDGTDIYVNLKSLNNYALSNNKTIIVRIESINTYLNSSYEFYFTAVTPPVNGVIGFTKTTNKYTGVPIIGEKYKVVYYESNSTGYVPSTIMFQSQELAIESSNISTSTVVAKDTDSTIKLQNISAALSILVPSQQEDYDINSANYAVTLLKSKDSTDKYRNLSSIANNAINTYISSLTSISTTSSFVQESTVKLTAEQIAINN
jgi:hypothetical protein